MVLTNLKEKKLSEIALIIGCAWGEKMYFGAKPYVEAMADLESIDDNYYYDTGKSIVLYFLANAQTWRGETARAVKKELKRRAGIK